MTIYKHKIVNGETGEEILVDYNADQIAEVEAGKIEAANRTAEAKAREDAKTALLAKLGITADEAKLLLS